MWQVIVVVCGLSSGCDRAAFPTPYATFEECREAGHRLMPAIARMADAYVARRGLERPVVNVRCDVPPGEA